MDHQILAELLFPYLDKTLADYEMKYPPRTLPEGAKVTRFAPSPTGFMHLGNLYGALVDERLAHQSGGIFYLRVEDTDQKREVPGGVQKILEMFDAFRLPADEGASLDGGIGPYGPFRQRLRAEIYAACAMFLTARGLAYPCFCTEAELEALRTRQAENKENFGYYGPFAACRTLSLDDIRRRLEDKQPYVLRLRSPGDSSRRIKFTDLVKGPLEFPENDQDIVILKSDGIPTYHFAHVVDDHFMRTTHVVRGDEWLATLPIHLQLFACMGWKPPKYVHTSAMMKMDGASKRKLSKRKDPELALEFYHRAGYPVTALKEYILTLLNSNFEEWRGQNPDKPLEEFPFSLKKMSVSGALFDLQKLDDVSKTVISRMTAGEAYRLLLAHAEEFDPDFAAQLRQDEAKALNILSIGRGGSKPRKDIVTWSQAKEYMAFFYEPWYAPGTALPAAVSPGQAAELLRRYRGIYDASADNAVWFETVRNLAGSFGFAADMKAYRQAPESFPGHVGDVSQVLRLAVTGREASPDLCEVMRILGPEAVEKRIDQAIQQYEMRACDGR